MGALLSGLIGAAGADIEKNADRAYQEKRQERADRMKILELAMSNPNYDVNRLPKDFQELDDLAKDAGYKTKQKGQFAQMGGLVGKILQRRKQMQARQAGAQDARTAVAGASGVTAQPAGQPGQPNIATPPFLPQQGPQGGAPGPQTPPMPPSRFLTREQQQALGEQEFQTGLKHKGQEVESQTESDKKRADTLTQYFKSQGMDDKAAREEADLVVFKKGKTPPGHNLAQVSFTQPGSAEVKRGWADPREPGAVFDASTGAKLEPGTFTLVAAPKTEGADELTKMTRIILAKQGLGGARKPTQQQIEAATQQAGGVLFKNKALLPQERLATTQATVRTIMGENGLLTVPTHRAGAMGAGPTATDFPNMTPPIPPSRLSQAGGGGAAAPLATPPAAAGGGERFVPEVKGAERPRKTNAEVIMGLGGRSIGIIGEVAQNHPEWQGASGPTWQAIVKKFGTADPSLGTLQGAMESLDHFLPSLHGFRSQAVIKGWKEVLDNPLRNPPLTQNVIREIMKAAQEVRDTILGRRVGPMTAEGEEEKAKKAAGGGGGASQAELDYMKKHGIQ